MGFYIFLRILPIYGESRVYPIILNENSKCQYIKEPRHRKLIFKIPCNIHVYMKSKQTTFLFKISNELDSNIDTIIIWFHKE